MDTPVKHYSSGMYVRLAFAVAAHRSAWPFPASLFAICNPLWYHGGRR